MSQYSRDPWNTKENPVKRIKLLLHVNFLNQPPLTLASRTILSVQAYTTHLGNETRYIFQTRQNIHQNILRRCPLFSASIIFSAPLWKSSFTTRSTAAPWEIHTSKRLVFLTSGSCCASGRTSGKRRCPLQVPLSFTFATKRKSPSFLTVLICFFFWFAKVAIDF